MSWLNWSLKLYIRLRTTHITHIYVQRIPYSFLWLYLIKCGVHTQSYVDKTHKYFWVFLVVFGNFFFFFFFLKNFRKSKKYFQLCFRDSLAGHASHEALVASLLRSSRDSLVSESPCRKKHLEFFFEISRFLAFLWLILATWSQVEAPVVSLHKRFRDSLANGPSNREKGLEKISKILFKGFWQLILATCSWVSWVAKMRVLHK